MNAKHLTKSRSKTECVLSELITRPLNRFEAEQLGDHCLHSTISSLANNHGIEFERQREKVPNRFGGHTPVVRYRLPVSEFAKAKRLLQLMEKRRQKHAQ